MDITLSADEEKQFRKSLNKAFRILRKNGYFARQNFRCCQTCGWDAVPPSNTQRAVFYHKQDAHDIPYGKVYLSWDGVGKEIIRALWIAGLYAIWNGEESKRILVKYTLDN